MIAPVDGSGVKEDEDEPLVLLPSGDQFRIQAGGMAVDARPDPIGGLIQVVGAGQVI